VSDGVAFLRGAECEEQRCAGDDEVAGALEVFARIARCGLCVRLNGGIRDRVQRAHEFTSLRMSRVLSQGLMGKHSLP